MEKLYSFPEGITLENAINWLGKMYVEFLLLNWPVEITLAIKNAWICNHIDLLTALCALTKSGEMAVREILHKTTTI